MRTVSSLLLLLCLSGSVLFAEAATPDSTRGPMRVGLVLSGGGARGLAHIGVIKVLEEAGIDVYCITGTSMGSIIGGLHAIGYSADEMEELVLGIDWDEVVYDQLPRRYISMEEKLEQGRYVGAFPIDVAKLSIKLPTGLVQGQNFQTLLSRLTLSVHHIHDFTKLPKPFTCMATDIETGEAVKLQSGSLTECIRASMSIPSMFTPVELDGHLLVDGGIVRNFPVNECRELGADFIIGSDVSTVLYKRDELASLVRIMTQCVSFAGIDAIMEGREESDILILPDVGEYSITDFWEADTLIALGEKAAREKLPELLELARRMEEKDEFASRPLLAVDSIFVVDIRTEGLDRVSTNLVIGIFRLKEGSWIKTTDLDRAVTRLYGAHYFERVSYTLEPVQGGVRLVLHLIERNTQDFRFGIRYSSDLKSAVLLNLTFRNLLVQGSKLAFDWRLSEYQAFAIRSFIHTGWKPGFGINWSIENDNFEVRGYEHGDMISTWDYSRDVVQANLQTLWSTAWCLGAGFEVSSADLKSVFSDTSSELDNFSLSYANLLTFLRVDTLDRTSFPRKGVKLNLQLRRIYGDYEIQGVKANPVVDQLILRYKEIAQVQDNLSVTLHLFGGVNHMADSVLVDQAFYVGGNETSLMTQFPFDGLRWMEEEGTDAFVTIVEGQMEVMKGVFVLGRLDLGKVAPNLEELFQVKDFFTGVGMGVGIMTPIGPMQWDTGVCTKTKKTHSSIRIGYQF